MATAANYIIMAVKMHMDLVVICIGMGNRFWIWYACKYWKCRTSNCISITGW